MPLPPFNLTVLRTLLEELRQDPSISESAYLTKRVNNLLAMIGPPPGRSSSTINQFIDDINSDEQRLLHEGNSISESVRLELVIQMLMEVEAWQKLVDEFKKSYKKITNSYSIGSITNLGRFLKHFTVGDRNVALCEEKRISILEIIKKILSFPINLIKSIITFSLSTALGLIGKLFLKTLHIIKYIRHPVVAYNSLKSYFNRTQTESKTAQTRHMQIDVTITKLSLEALLNLFKTDRFSFYGLMQNDASATILGMIVTNDGFKQHFLSLTEKGAEGSQQLIDFLSQYIEILTSDNTKKAISPAALTKHYTFIDNLLLPMLETMLTKYNIIEYREKGIVDDSQSYFNFEKLLSLSENIRLLKAMPHYSTHFDEIERVQTRLKDVTKLIQEATQLVSLPDATEKTSYKPKKLCLILQGSCAQPGVANGLGVVTKALENNPEKNLVYQLAGPSALGDGGDTIVAHAVRIFSDTFEDWIGSWGPNGPTCDFEMFTGGYSRGAVNCLRVSYQIHQKLSDPKYLEKLMPLLPENYRNIEQIKQILRQRVHVDMYVHDPVPGQISRMLNVKSGFVREEEFHLPKSDFDLLRKVCVVFSEDEKRSMFDTVIMRPQILQEYVEMVKKGDPDKTVQILAGNHSAGLEMGYNSYDEMVPEIRALFATKSGEKLTVQDLLDRLSKDQPWKVDYVSCGDIVGQLLSIAMARDIAGEEVKSAIAFEDTSRNAGRTIALAEHITPEQELECFALIKMHNKEFKLMTEIDESFGSLARDSSIHARVLQELGVDRTKGKTAFFHNTREESIFTKLYPKTAALLLAHDKTMALNAFESSFSDIFNELKKLAENNRKYGFQVIVAIAAKLVDKTVTFNDVNADTYWGNFFWSSTANREKELAESYKYMLKMLELAAKKDPNMKKRVFIDFLDTMCTRSFKTPIAECINTTYIRMSKVLSTIPSSHDSSKRLIEDLPTQASEVAKYQKIPRGQRPNREVTDQQMRSPSD